MTPRDKGRQLNTATLTCSRSYFGRVQKISIGRGHAIRKKQTLYVGGRYIYFLLFFFWWRVSWFDDVWPAALSADLSLQSLSWKWTCVTFDIFAETKCSAREKSACQTRAIFLSETVEKRREIDGRWLSPGEKKRIRRRGSAVPQFRSTHYFIFRQQLEAGPKATDEADRVFGQESSSSSSSSFLYLKRLTPLNAMPKVKWKSLGVAISPLFVCCFFLSFFAVGATLPLSSGKRRRSSVLAVSYFHVIITTATQTTSFPLAFSPQLFYGGKKKERKKERRRRLN